MEMGRWAEARTCKICRLWGKTLELILRLSPGKVVCGTTVGCAYFKCPGLLLLPVSREAPHGQCPAQDHPGDRYHRFLFTRDEEALGPRTHSKPQRGNQESDCLQSSLPNTVAPVVCMPRPQSCYPLDRPSTFEGLGEGAPVTFQMGRRAAVTAC